MLGLHCCSGFSLVVENGDHSLAVACELLLVVASLGEAWALGPMVSVVVAPQLSNTGSIVAHEPSYSGMWDLSCPTRS